MNNKEVAQKFLELVIGSQIDEAFEKYVHPDFKHHNLFSPAGREGLKQSMKENESQFPDKQMHTKHILAEGDLVAAHSHVILKSGEVEIAAVHLMRFQDGKIIEMWDVGQPITKDSPNIDGAF